MRAWLFAAAIAALPLPALGNGAISEFPAGGVQFVETTDIAIAREDLFLSLEQVRVHYDYRSDASAPIKATIGFPMPAVPIDGGPDQLGGALLEEGANPLNYMSFEAKVNGEPVKTVLHEYAWFEGQNITEELKAAQVPLYLPYDQTNELLGDVDKAVLDDLIQRGLLVRTADGDLGEPLWQYQAVYEWQQDFAPGVTQVDISYVPLTGYPSDILDYYEVDPDGLYCVDNGVRQMINDYRSKGIGYEVQTMSYILTTARYWKGPIEEFNLIVDKEKPDPENGITGAVLSFCGMRDAQETEDDFRLRKKNFDPAEDISVVWYAFYDFSGTDEGAQ